MKIFLVSAFVLSFSVAGFGAAQTLLDCRVVKVVNDNEFEEGLSTFEYPDMEVTKTSRGAFEVRLGAMIPWKTKEEDTIKVIVNTEDTKVVQFKRFNPEESEYTSNTYYIRATRNTAGKLVAKLSGKAPGEKESLIAIAYCK